MRCAEIVSILEIMNMGEQGFTQREIAAATNCGKSTVNDIQQRCRNAGLSYEEASKMSNSEIRTRLYPSKAATKKKEEVNWESIHAWLRGSKSRNLQYAWEEYRLKKQDGLCYSQYCRRYRQWREATGKTVTMVQNHEPGKELFVDWMGDTLDCVKDPTTGRLQTAHFFVATLGYSCYPYVEAFPDEGEDNWLKAHIHTFEYIKGTPRVVVPDNCKTAVTKPNYYDPKLNPAYWELAKYYNVAVIPARVRKPKDKAIVEGSVGWLETWLLEWVRGSNYFDFAELNREIKRRVKTLAERPFQERKGSRASEYEALDRTALRPLPAKRFECVQYVTRRVPDNYHVEYEGFYYSVPYTLFKQDVTIRASGSMVEIMNNNRECVALHQRRYDGTRYITEKAHMPEKHQRQYENSHRNGNDYLHWAATIGENTRIVIERVLKSQHFEETTYRSCMGILQFEKKYSTEKLEAACEQALRIGSPTYTTITKLLKNPIPESPQRPLPPHENLRNPSEFS